MKLEKHYNCCIERSNKSPFDRLLSVQRLNSESSSLVSVLFREAFDHPYISFYHLLVNGFSIIIIIIINFFRRVFSEYTEANATSLIPLDAILPEICAFIIGFSFTMWIKMGLFIAH